MLSPTNLYVISAIGVLVASMSSDVLLSSQLDNSELDASDQEYIIQMYVSGREDKLNE